MNSGNLPAGDAASTVHEFFIITPYPSVDPIGHPLSHFKMAIDWEILKASEAGVETVKVTQGKSLAEVIKALCNDDETSKWDYHSAESPLQDNNRGKPIFEFVDFLMEIASDETPEDDVTDDHPVEEIRSAFIDSGLYDRSMPSPSGP